MKVYFTTERYSKLKDIVTNLGSFYVINVPEIVNRVKDPTTPYAEYYINNVIISSFKEALSMKKYIGVVYINKNIDKRVLDNIKEIDKELSANDYILLDNSILPKHKNIYNWFEEITFFTRLKKIKL